MITLFLIFLWRVISTGKGSDDVAEERIDRALATGEWMDLFPNAILHNIMAPISGHSPILLCLSNSIGTSRRRHFKFTNGWLLESSLRDTIQDSWANNHAGCIIEKVDKCASDINRWAMKLRSHFRKDIGQCEDASVLALTWASQKCILGTILMLVCVTRWPNILVLKRELGMVSTWAYPPYWTAKISLF